MTVTVETLRQAAVREVREETGIDIAEESFMHPGFAEGDGTVGELAGPMRDDVFVAVPASAVVVIDGMERHELAALDQFRW